MAAGRQLGRFLAGKLDRPFKAALEQAHRLQQRRLARTGRSEQRDNFIGMNVEINAAKHLDHDIALHKAALHIAQFDSLPDHIVTHSGAPEPDRCWRPCRQGKGWPGN